MDRFLNHGQEPTIQKIVQCFFSICLINSIVVLSLLLLVIGKLNFSLNCNKRLPRAYRFPKCLFNCDTCQNIDIFSFSKIVIRCLEVQKSKINMKLKEISCAMAPRDGRQRAVRRCGN